MKKLTLLSILAATTLMITGCGSKKDSQCVALDISIGDIAQIVPAANSTVCRDTAFFDILDQNGETAGAILLSEPYTNKIIGFKGPTPLRIILDGNQKTALVEMLDNDETPSYARRVVNSGLLEKWNGLAVDEVMDSEVDAVSGATYTSNAVIETMKTRISEYQRQTKKETPTRLSFGQRLKKLFGAK